MYKGLIDHLTFTYGFLCKGRGKLNEDEMRAIAGGARVMTDRAPEVLGKSEEEMAEDRADLAEARKITQHVEEMSVFLMSLEIV